MYKGGRSPTLVSHNLRKETAMDEIVTCRIDGGIAWLTLNRPEKLNALSYAMIDRLMDRLDALEPQAAVGALILTGAGERAFSAGGDIPEFAESVRNGPEEALRLFVRRGQALTARIEGYPKPLIVAVNGLAFGGGCEITEAAPLAVASDRALFAKPEIKLGMPPTFGGTQRLPRLAGRKRALGLLLTGEPFSPAAALEMGLVNKVVPHADLLAEAERLAAQILRHSPLAVARILTAVTRGLNLPIEDGLRLEAEQFARMVPTRDLGEGLAGFCEKRPPRFVGA
jgi:enoyl-CoA hydratase/carnithine racemase